MDIFWKSSTFITYLATVPSLSVPLAGSLSDSWCLTSLLLLTGQMEKPSFSPLGQLGRFASLPALWQRPEGPGMVTTV